MRRGQLKERVDIQRPVETKGEGGGVSVAYATEFPSVAARVEYQGGRKYFDADSVLSASVVRVTIAYRKRLTLKHVFRVRPDGPLLKIHSAQPDERRTEIVCLCERSGA